MFLYLVACSLCFSAAQARAVNLSSVWLLPEEGYPVFYRYFRDRITWYEAEAVCQFHHGQLITVDTDNEFDAARAYLKELDVTNFVWTGLKKSGPNSKFLWPENKMMTSEGHWLTDIPKSQDALCAAVDPTADFRWNALSCSGPQAASFICQMEVPRWAITNCMVTSLPSLTVTFLPEQGAVELVSDCGLEGTRRITCKGQSNRDDLVKQLSCESCPSTAAFTSSPGEVPTRHRRQSVVTPVMGSQPESSTKPLPTNDDEVSTETKVESTTINTPDITKSTAEETVNFTSQKVEADLTTDYHQSTEKVFHIPIPDSESVMPKVPKEEVFEPRTGEPSDVRKTRIPEKEKLYEEEIRKAEIAIKREEARKASIPSQNKLGSGVKDDVSKDNLKEKAITVDKNVLVPLQEEAALTSNAAANTNTRTILISSKPIPPSLGGNSPFLEKVVENVTTDEIEKDSHESFNESPTEFTKKGNMTGIPAPVSVSETMEDSGETHFHDNSTLLEDDSTTETPVEPDLPERPNRGRLLLRPQHHSFYPYFLNRVLG